MTASVSCDSYNDVIAIVIQLFLFLSIKNLKTEVYLHSTDESEEEEKNTFSSNLQDLTDFLIFASKFCLRFLLYFWRKHGTIEPFRVLITMMELWKKFLLFTLIYAINILGFAISLEKFYSVFSQ